MFNEILIQFENCQNWAEKYRLLIKLAHQLPQPNEDTLKHWFEVKGCESRLWVEITASPFQFNAYSDARLMQGLLMLITLAIKEKSFQQLQTFNIIQFLEQIGITSYLTATRLNGLLSLQQYLKSELTNITDTAESKTKK